MPLLFSRHGRRRMGSAYQAGIHLNFATGVHYVKPVGGPATIAPFTSLFTFTGGNQSMYRGASGLLVASATNTPRIEYDANGNLLGLLIEGARTNLCLQSQDLATTWANTNSTESVNAIAAPDGTTTADKLVEDNTAGAQHRINQSITISNTTSYTFSIFAKAGERLNVALRISAGSDFAQAHFNLSAGTVGGIVGAATITPYGNGWYRCSITGTSDGTSGTVRVNLGNTATSTSIDSYNGDGSSGVYLWGGQLEAGSFPSSYIPTTTGSVARTVDTCLRTFGSEVSQSVGTYFFEADSNYSASQFQTVFGLDDGTLNERHLTQFVNLALQGSTVDGGVSQASFTSAAVADRVMTKAAYGYEANNFGFAVSGTLSSPDASGTLPTTTTARIGHRGTAIADNLFGHIRRLDYWPERKANAELQRLTS